MALWVAMSVNIPTYMLARSGMIAGGDELAPGRFHRVPGGTSLKLAPMLLNAHAGAKYGIPFPLFLRGRRLACVGANVPAVLALWWRADALASTPGSGAEQSMAMVVVLFPRWQT